MRTDSTDYGRLFLDDLPLLDLRAPVEFSRVQADEIFIVVIVLFVWAGAVYVFFNQWGKTTPFFLFCFSCAL